MNSIHWDTPLLSRRSSEQPRDAVEVRGPQTLTPPAASRIQLPARACPSAAAPSPSEDERERNKPIDVGLAPESSPWSRGMASVYHQASTNKGHPVRARQLDDLTPVIVENTDSILDVKGDYTILVIRFFYIFR
jgi:hypothetical protein